MHQTRLTFAASFFDELHDHFHTLHVFEEDLRKCSVADNIIPILISYLFVWFLPVECEILYPKILQKVIELLPCSVDHVSHFVRYDELQILRD